MFRKLLGFLAGSDILIALAATSSALQTVSESGQKLMLKPFIFLIFFASLCEYRIHRIIKHRLDKKHQKETTHQRFYPVVLLLGLAGLTVSSLYCRPIVILACIPPALVSILYSLPLLPIKGRFIRFRDLPFMKTIMVAFSWAWVSVMIPAAYYDLAEQIYLPLFLLRFLLIFGLTVPFEIRDMETDKNEGVYTIAHFAGKEKSIVLSVLLFIAMIITAFGLYYTNNSGFLSAYSISGLLCIVTVVSGLKYRSKNYYHLIDSMILIQAMLVIAFTI